MTPQADFNYEVFEKEKLIAITDMNSGKKTVTNDIENVVDEIGKMEKIDPKHYMIIYRDTMNFWDGWDATIRDFIILRCDTVKDAILKYAYITQNK